MHIGNDDRVAFRALNEGFLAIGQPEIGNLAPHNTRQKTYVAYEATLPARQAKVGQFIVRLALQVCSRLACRGTCRFPGKADWGNGHWKHAGPYRRSSDPDLAEYPHIRQVEWLAVVQRTAFTQVALYSFGSLLTVGTSNDYLEEVVIVASGKGESGKTEAETAPPTPSRRCRQTHAAARQRITRPVDPSTSRRAREPRLRLAAAASYVVPILLPL